jgi:hypothetical protein
MRKKPLSVVAALTAPAVTTPSVQMARRFVNIATDRDLGRQAAIFDAGYNQATFIGVSQGKMYESPTIHR